MIRLRPLFVLFALALTAAFGQPVWHGYTPTGGGSPTGGGPALLGTPAEYGPTTQTTDSTYSFPATLAAGSDRLLVVHIVVGANVYSVDGVRYGGVSGAPMARLATYEHGGVSKSELWYLKESDLAGEGNGTHDVYIDLSGNIAIAASTVFFENVNQIDTFSAHTRNFGDGGSATITAASTADQLVLVALGYDDGGGIDLAGISGCTEETRVQETISNRRWSVVAVEAGGTTVTCTWEAGQPFHDWQVVEVKIK